MMDNTCVVDGRTYYRVFAEDNNNTCRGCVAHHGTNFCKSLGKCIEAGIDYIWVNRADARSAVTNNKAYDICMAEHYKYLQYDTVEMDDFERGCIVGRKLQSEKLARMIK